ncbi:MAG: transcriptional regulator [Archaeoglobales archaeon]|nr:MAG: transcriptional regulator [Archaeoglobales archaeon]
MSMRRGKWEIIASILEALEKGGSKTRIQYNSYLNYKSFKKYFDLLLAEGFVEKSNPEYKLTEKGKRLLEKLRELNSEFQEL